MAFVLVADPSPVVGRFIRLALAREGHQVIRAARASVALEIVGQTKPDIVIMETSMDDMDGRAFFEALRGAGYTRPVLVLSHEGARQFAEAVGAEAALEKPFDVEDFLKCVRDLIDDG